MLIPFCWHALVVMAMAVYQRLLTRQGATWVLLAGRLNNAHVTIYRWSSM